VIREDLCSIKQQDCGDVDNYVSWIDRKVKDYNLCAGPSTTGTDAADTDTDANAKTIAQMSEQEHILYLLRGIPRNDKWNVFLELIMDNNATMTATPDVIVPKLVEKEAAIQRENGFAPEALFFAKKGGKGSRGGKVGKIPNRDKRDNMRDNKDDRKQKDLRKCFHCQQRGHITENCLSKQRGDPPMAADTAAQASTEASATSTLTTSIENYWMVASSDASSSDWFIDCGCMTHISSRRSMFIIYTAYHPNTKKVKGYNSVTSFASGYGNVWLIRQLPDGMTETIILQEVVHLPGSFNLISQSQIMDKDVIFEPVNHYSLNLYNRHGKLIATAPQVDGLFVLDHVLDLAPELTDYTDINNDSCLLALYATGHASRHDAEKRMIWHRRLPHVGFKALEVLPMITDAQRMTGKCDCESCIKCKLARKPFTPNTTSRATEPLQMVHSDICGPLETAIGGGRYMLLFNHDATRHTDEYILKYKSEALEEFKEWKALREKELGKQVKRFCTDGGGEYTSKKFAEYLKSEGILNETTTPYTPRSNWVIERANRTIMERVRCMLGNGRVSKIYRAFAVSVAVYLKTRTPTRSVVGKTPYETWHGRNPFLKHLCVFGCLAVVHVPNEKQMKLDYRPTPGIFVGYSILTPQYFVYDPLAKTHHCSRDVVSREGKRYTAPNAADEAILNTHCYRDVIVEPTPTKKQSGSSQPIEKQPTERQTEETLDDDSPPDPPNQQKKSRELAGLETSPGHAWKPPAEGSHRNRSGKAMLAESAQLALEDKEFQDMIPIYAAAVISDSHEDGINDPNSYKAAMKSPFANKCDMAMKEDLDVIGQHQVFGDFMELLEGRKALPSHWVYKIKRDGARNV